MALKIRRGTQAELDALTGSSAAGEPIYTTDTGKLYVGDGSSSTGTLINPDKELGDLEKVNTAGKANGQALVWNTNADQWEPQTIEVTQSIDDLTDVDNTGVINNKVLKWDSTANGGEGAYTPQDEAFLSFDLDAQLAGKSIDGFGDVSTSGVDDPGPGQVLTWDNNAAQWKPQDIDLNTLQIAQLNADIQGSVFADDSTQLVDAVNGTVKLDNGTISITGNVIQPFNVGTLEFGALTDTASPTFEIYNVDAAPPIDIINLAGTNIGGMPKLMFSSRHGDMETPVQATAGDFVGGLSGRVYDPSTEGYVPTSIIAFQVDPNETVAADTAKGKILFINNEGTGSGPALNTMSYDARGYLAINNNGNYVADATLDVNGFMKLAPLTAEPGTPLEGMIAIADGTTWDPATKGGALSYPVYYDGTSWNALY